jgi:hypothetical protein
MPVWKFDLVFQVDYPFTIPYVSDALVDFLDQGRIRFCFFKKAEDMETAVLQAFKQIGVSIPQAKFVGASRVWTS